jgi:uncharacterized damage-inducible protein DinB
MALLDVNRTVIERLIAFVQQMPKEDYQQPLSIFNGSSLGEHTRHIIEFYQCLMVQSSKGFVSYDLRDRNCELQLNPLAAKAALQVIWSGLEHLKLDKDLVLEVNPHNQDTAPQQLITNVARELHYLLDHTIHHMALIKIGVQITLPNLHLPADFGVAPSTIRSRTAVVG